MQALVYNSKVKKTSRAFLTACLVALVAVFFLGCTTDNNESNPYGPPNWPWNWAIVLLIQFEFNFEIASEPNYQQKIKALEDSLGHEDIIDVASRGKILQVALAFDVPERRSADTALKEFANFFDLTVAVEPVKEIWTERAFTSDRTLTFENPWKTVFEDKDATAFIDDEIIQTVKARYGSPERVRYIYEFSTNFRRTAVSAGDKQAELFRDGLAWNYFILVDRTIPGAIPDIVILDRYANSPPWYGVAVVATIIFMALMYIVFRTFANSKRKRYNNTQWDSQSSPTFTET